MTLIHAVDRYSLLKEIEKQAAKRDLEMPVLIQVNIAKEEVNTVLKWKKLMKCLVILKISSCESKRTYDDGTTY